MDAAQLAREVKPRRARRARGRAGLRLSRDQEFRRAQSRHRHRPHLPLAGQRPHPDRDRQVHRRQAQRAARHARHGRAGDAGGRRQHSLLLVVPAGDLHRADHAVAARHSAKGINVAHKLVRMQARPKILLASNFEDAAQLVQEYRDYICSAWSRTWSFRGRAS